MRQLHDVIKKTVAQALANTHTATIGKVVKVNAKTVDVQPVINTSDNVKLPVFPEVPVLFMQGGASYTAHPIAVGDYALLVFAERSFDYWWIGSDNVPPPENRQHDYSDAIAIVGLNPQASGIDIPEDRTMQGDTLHNGDLVVNGDLIVNGDITCTGTLTVPTILTQTVTAATGVSIAGIEFGDHTHPESGGGTTGAPQ